MMAGPVAESRFGYSEDENMSEDAIKELIQAVESKDSQKLMSSLKALIEIIRNKNEADAH